MPRIAENLPWQDPSTNGLRYLFTTKHHGGPGPAGQCRWLLELEFRAEFWILDQADAHQFLDDKSRLFGMLKTPTSKCKTIGTQDEQGLRGRPHARLATESRHRLAIVSGGQRRDRANQHPTL
jgi:hypothetical protein